jgi:hypothetical protein
MKRTDNATLISALRILARDIQSEDGIANAAIAEAADRIEKLVPTIKPLKWRKTKHDCEFVCRVECLEYTVWGAGFWCVSVCDYDDDTRRLAQGVEKTLDAAKAKCQKHFERHAKAVLKACGVSGV